MSQLFGQVFDQLASSFLRGIGDNNKPEVVLDVKVDAYLRQQVVCREDCLVMYGPEKGQFDIVLQKPFEKSLNSMYSLCRGADQAWMYKKFQYFRDKLLVLLESNPALFQKDMLQKICDIIKDHPYWTAAHIAAQLGLVECFQNQVIQSQINAVCQQTGMTSLHIVVSAERLKVLQVMMAYDPIIDVPDERGNTVLHIAASKNKDFINVLCARSTLSINHKNTDGYTPLHLACMADKPECVKALLFHGADVNVAASTADALPIHTALEYSSAGCVKTIIEMYPNLLHVQDMKYGGSPLHWAKSRQIIDSLVELKCNLDTPNFLGSTALHVMVERDRLSCVLALLCHGANINAANNDGETALHVAAQNMNLIITQALVVFGADMSLMNNKGETARHIVALSKQKERDQVLFALHAVGAPRCKNIPSCSDGCKENGSYNGTPLTNTCVHRTRELFDDMLSAAVNTEVAERAAVLTSQASSGDSSAVCRPQRILCLDGGGIRGLILIQILAAIEKVSGQLVLHSFDWISGTSTGGILALALATGKSVRECLNMYFTLKDKVFNGRRPYPPEPFEVFLKQVFGETTTMADIKHPKVAVTGVLADRHPADLHMFRNYTSPILLLDLENTREFPCPPKPEDQLVWKAARASGAAPTYFTAMGRFVDGGLIANNPTLDILTEVFEYNYALKSIGQGCKKMSVGCVVSLGTGRIPVEKVSAIDVFQPDSLWGSVRMAMGIPALVNLLIDQATSSDYRVVDRARAWCGMMGVPYYRYNPVISSDIALDETDDTTLVKMLWETMSYMQTKYKELTELGRLLQL